MVFFTSNKTNKDLTRLEYKFLIGCITTDVRDYKTVVALLSIQKPESKLAKFYYSHSEQDSDSYLGDLVSFLQAHYQKGVLSNGN